VRVEQQRKCRAHGQRRVDAEGAGGVVFKQDAVAVAVSNIEVFGAVAAVPLATNYDWYAKDESNPANPFILKQSENSNTADFPLGNNKGNRYYTIRVIATNPCGSLQSIDADGYLFAPLCSGMLILATPNPASSNIDVQVVDDQGELSTIPGQKIYELQVVDKLGTLRKQYKFPGGIKQTNINISSLATDIYILLAYDGTIWTSIEIVKN